MVKNLVRLGIASLSLAALISTAVAQTTPGQQGQGGGGRRGGRGGFGGPGGPGGGFGQGGFNRGGRQNSHDPLVTHVLELIQRSDVQTELHLDLRQKAAVKEIGPQVQQEMQQQMQQMFQSMRGNRGNRGGNAGGATGAN